MSNDKYSLMDVHIETGRKNQIRVHFKEANHPIVGDEKYLSTCSPIARLGLHAKKLVIKNPLNDEVMTFVANEDPIFKKVFEPNFKEAKPKSIKKEEIKNKKKKK